MCQLGMMRGGVMVVIMAALLFQCNVVTAATYKVNWAPHSFQDMTVKAGDTIEFDYFNTLEYNVIEVDVDAYKGCRVGGPTVYHTGKDQFTLTKGDHYFICGVFHCQAPDNMKIKITAI